MSSLKCSVPTCKHNKNNCCQAESVMVNAIRPECSSKEGTYCNAYEQKDNVEQSKINWRKPYWDY